MTLQDILNALPTLKPAQLDKLVAATSHLRGEPKTVPGDRAQVVFDSLHSFLAGAGVSISPRLPQTTVWKSQVAIYLAFVEKTTPGLSRIEFRALARLYAGALVDCCVKNGFAPRHAVRMVGRVADAVERAFPGYAEAGVLQNLVRKAGNSPVQAPKGEGASSGA